MVTQEQKKTYYISISCDLRNSAPKLLDHESLLIRDPNIIKLVSTTTRLPREGEV